MKVFTKMLSVLVVMTLSSAIVFGQTVIFEDDFDSYSAGGQVACQNPTVWTTWSNAPCGSEDAYVSNLYAHSGVNSAVIAPNNDLVKDFGDAFTSGKYKISFWVYIPTGKAGYFNTLANFAATSAWGLEVYFNAGGAGSINAGGTGAASFFWNENAWFLIENVVDLDADHAEIWIDGSMLYDWQWSLGSNGVAIPNTLDANDFFGSTANDQMYFDDYSLEDMSVPPFIFEYDFENFTSGGQVACQFPLEWTTWSNAPCGTEDAYVSSEQAFSGVNSVEVTGTTTDLVKEFEDYTTGHYKISFQYYVVNGYVAYFNTLQDFAGASSQWGMQVYFGSDNVSLTPGEGWIDGGGSLAASFNFDYDTWMLIEVDVDLDQDWAEFYVDGNLVHGWIWSSGAFGTGTLNQLSANDFFAYTGATVGTWPCKYFFDDYTFEELSAPQLPPPTNLTLTTPGNNVVLNWVAPAGKAFNKNIPIQELPEYYSLLKDYKPQYDPRLGDEGNNDPSRIISPNGPNYQAKGELDCPEGSLFDQSCMGYTTGVTSEVDPGYKVFQYYSGVGGTITTITFWGINAWYNGTAWQACAEDPMDFNIEIYADNAGAPDLNNLLNSYSASIDGFETGEFFAGSYEVMRYTFDVPGGLGYSDGWIMVQGDGNANCWFLWVDSGTPGTLSYQDAGTGPAQTTYVQSLCLGGILSENDLGIQSIISPESGVNLGNAVPVTVMIQNYGSAAQSNFNISYTMDGGTPVNATITATIAGGATLNYTFPGTVDLSAYGTYEFEACTYLAGDENAVNDCKTKIVENIFTGLLGYNVYHSYQNGTFSVLAYLTPTTYTHVDPPGGLHKYYVTAVYDNGESEPSNTVEVLLTGVQENVVESTQVYPNPANDLLFIKSEFNITSVKVYNYAGQIISNEVANTRFCQFNTSKLNPGLYLFQIETNEGSITKRIIIE